MDKDSQYFYVSGALSLSIFTFFISLFFYTLFSIKETKIFALTKDTFVSISLEAVPTPSSSSKKNVETPVEKKEKLPEPVEPKPIEKESVEKPVKKEVNIDNLFSSVVTKDLKKESKKEEKPSDKRVTEDLKKKSQKSEETKVQSITSRVQSMNSNNKSEQDLKTSAGTDVNEYYAKIQALVYENFFPPSNSQGKIVKAVIELNSMGKVIDFRILNYSNHDGLNSEVNKLKERLLSLVFPKNPDNKSGRYEIILIPEEKF